MFSAKIEKVPLECTLRSFLAILCVIVALERAQTIIFLKINFHWGTVAL